MPLQLLKFNIMLKQTNFVFKGLTIVSWIIFVGLCIEAGAMIVNFIFSLYNPEFVSKLYQKLDLSEMYQQSKKVYYWMYSFVLVLSILKSILFYIVISLLWTIDMSKPFSSFVSKHISQISYFTFSIGIVSFIAKTSANKLQNQGFEMDILQQFWCDSQAYILMSAVVYVISSIFKKGVEMQIENDLTV